MKQLLFFITALFLIASCTNSEGSQKLEKNGAYAEYFFPTDSLIPYIYAFQNTKEKLDEKLLRIYRSETPEDTSLVVEFYNADLKITEGYTHDLIDQFKVSDHMIVDGDGLKRQAKISANTFFPQSKDDQTQFISDFPSHLDSITMIYQSKRRVIEENKMVNVLGKEVPAIIVEDSVKFLFANPFTKKSSARSAMIKRTFAKGYGMVGWSTNDEKIVYKLEKILPNKWWEEYARSPQVVM